MGLALGGGIGYLLRPHGLTADNIINASVVLANGTQVQLSQFIWLRFALNVCALTSSNYTLHLNSQQKGCE